jgi:hypothetical protein
LKYICLGRGIQNYTCATATSVPVSIGAIATLFDATKFATNNPALFNTIPAEAVYMPLLSSFFIIKPDIFFHAIGHHFFSANGTPIFNLSFVGDILYGRKTADIKAPATANRGPAGTGAVDWLQLQDQGGSVGVREAYRVVTAGGAAPLACTSVDLISVQYAAEYWFYGWWFGQVMAYGASIIILG